MKIPVLLLLFALPLHLSAADAPPESAKDAAVRYFIALTGANANAADHLSTAPFSLDRQKVLHTMDEVRAVHRKIAKDKGARDFKPDRVVLNPKGFTPLDEKIFGDTYQVVRVFIEDEAIDIYVDKRDKRFAVIGFSD